MPSPVLGMAVWLRRVAQRYPARPALTCDDTTWTYAELQVRIEALAAVLAGRGVKAGDRVGYLGFNDPLFLVALFASARLNVIFVPLNFRLAGPEIAFIAEDAGVCLMLADAYHRPVIDGIRSGLRCAHYLSVDGAAPGWDALAPLDVAPASVPPEVAVEPDEVALIMYTSGTTGHPKGAMLTHGNFWTNNLNGILSNGLSCEDITLNFSPLFHVGGLCSVSLPAMGAGGHLVLHRAWDAEAVMSDIAKYRVSVTFAVPSMLLFMSQHPGFDSANLSTLRTIAVGGAPMPVPLLQRYAARGIPVNQGFGMTETCATVSLLVPERGIDKQGSCGTPALLTEVRLTDYDGQPITQPHVRGELCIRGGNVMKGYWNRPDATAASFDGEGWFRSGDVAYVDEDGFYFICDRLKDMVISGGENVYPAEVESVLYRHPAIAEVAVIGAPDERWGERVVAVAALKPGASLSLEELQAYAREGLAGYKVPRELRLVEALPRNPTGKVLKGKLREQNPPL
jgi:fatty-acyl-CoA synthase